MTVAEVRFSDEFAVQVEHLDDAIAVVHVHGELDLATCPHLTATLDAVDPGCQLIVLNLQHVGFADSSAMHLLLARYRRSQDGGPEFVVSGAGGDVLRVLRLAGIDTCLAMAPDLQSAIANRVGADADDSP